MISFECVDFWQNFLGVQILTSIYYLQQDMYQQGKNKSAYTFCRNSGTPTLYQHSLLTTNSSK